MQQLNVSMFALFCQVHAPYQHCSLLRTPKIELSCCEVSLCLGIVINVLILVYFILCLFFVAAFFVVAVLSRIAFLPWTSSDLSLPRRALLLCLMFLDQFSLLPSIPFVNPDFG